MSEFVPAFKDHKVALEEFLLLREENMVRVGVAKVGAVKRLLIGKVEKHKTGWTKSSLPSIISDQRTTGLMLNTPTDITMVASTPISVYIRQQGRGCSAPEGDLVTPLQLRRSWRGGATRWTYRTGRRTC